MIPEARIILTLLEKKKSREKEGLFVLEGEKLVEEGLDHIKFFIYSQNLPVVVKAKEMGIPGYKVSKEVMEKITSVETPPGIIAVSEIRHWNIENVAKDKNPIILFAIEVQDPGNMGTMIRTVDAVGGSGVIASRGTVDHYNPKVVRSTMGSIFRVPVALSNDVEETINLLKKNNIKIVGTSLSAKKNYWDADLSGPIALLVGNESNGINDEVLKLCDETVKIPMPGHAESLNAAMASSLLLYETLRQRTHK